MWWSRCSLNFHRPLRFILGQEPPVCVITRLKIERIKSGAGRVYHSYWDLGLGDNMSKSKLSNCLKLIFVIAITSELFSCKSQGVNLETLDPNLYDQSWLIGKPCGAPCWYGLEPGVSSREDSIAEVKRFPFIDGNSETFTDLEGVDFCIRRPGHIVAWHYLSKTMCLTPYTSTRIIQITFRSSC